MGSDTTFEPSNPLHWFGLLLLLVLFVSFNLAWQQLCSTSIADRKKMCIRVWTALFATSSLIGFILASVYILQHNDELDKTLAIYIRTFNFFAVTFGLIAFYRNLGMFFRSFYSNFSNKPKLKQRVATMWSAIFYAYLMSLIISNITAFLYTSVIPLWIGTLATYIYALLASLMVCFPLSILACRHSQTQPSSARCDRHRCYIIIVFILIIIAIIMSIVLLIRHIIEYRHYNKGSFNESPVPDLQSFLLSILRHAMGLIFNILYQWHPMALCNDMHYSALCCVLLCQTDDVATSDIVCRDEPDTHTTQVPSDATETNVLVTVTPTPLPLHNDNAVNISLLPQNRNSISQNDSLQSLPAIVEMDEKEDLEITLTSS